MTEGGRRYALNAQLDIEQILLEAQNRWLRPAEICEILLNYKKFRIAPEPPNRPPNGSLFLFDRKVLRYFRKDGHNWRKKKDGKTVKEAHERLKAGSVDVLHCYYAHGEDNENFQRRSYWMLEEELSHIVLVHYREVKGHRTNYSRIRDAVPHSRQTEENISNSEADSSAASRFQPYDYNQGLPQVTDTTSLSSTQASEHEDAQSAYKNHASPGFQSIHELQSPEVQQREHGSIPYYPAATSNNYQGQFSPIADIGFGPHTQGGKNKSPTDNGLAYDLHQSLGYQSWENIIRSSSAGNQSVTFPPSSNQSNMMSLMSGQDNELLDQVFTGALGKRQEFGNHSNGLGEWQASDGNLNLGQSTYDPSLTQPLPYDVNQVELSDSVGFRSTYPTAQTAGTSSKPEPDRNINVDDKSNYPSSRQPLLHGIMREGLKKLDSFDRWMTIELGDVTESTMRPTSGMYWEPVGSEDGDESGDNFILAPSLSQDQLFSIIDFSPNWAFPGSEVKILVMGKFLRSQEEVEKYKWACMFGELEVPAEIVADGVLRCHTPSHQAGRVPFYITCSNRLACSEVREFEFRSSTVEDVGLDDVGTISSDENLLYMRFGKLLSLQSASVQSIAAETSQLSGKITALLKDDTEWEQMLNLSKQDEFSADKVKDQLLQKLLKEKLHAWLLQKIAEGGKGPSVLDEGGQGVLHFAAALGYDWAIPPTIAAGVSVNFRDANGWTALHWAAYYGRERTVAFLMALGANPGALTDPSPTYPSGQPADLAANNGHKGIAGYLAEAALSSHLSSLKLEESEDSNNSRDKAIETVSKRTATPVGDGEPSLKDSLAAVRNATQAAARIHQVFRVQSFQRKQINEYGDNEFGISDERALSLLALKSKKAGQHHEPVHAAAVRIQNKFRSWKGRKDFLLIRQQIIKIQAHVRGHQVRKNYKKIIWSVGILDKVILRWRRKGRGLRNFKPEAGTSMVDTETKEDDYDFLKEGRKQTEERLQKALSRVKSMVQYPEARDQYHRLLNVVSEMQETKAVYDKLLNDSEVDFDDDLIDVDALLEDESFMSSNILDLP